VAISHLIDSLLIVYEVAISHLLDYEERVYEVRLIATS